MEYMHNHNDHGESPRPKKGLAKVAFEIHEYAKDKIGRYIIALAIGLILVLVFVYALKAIDYQPHSKTSIDTKITLIENDFSWASGCIAYVEGTVTNTGQGDANDVIVSCTAKTNKKDIRTTDFYLGAVRYNGERKFNERVTYGCLEGGLFEEVYVECNSHCQDGSCSPG